MTSPATPARRSKRDRKSNARYDDQLTWDEAAQLLRAESNSPDRSSDSSSPEAIEKGTDPDADADILADDAIQANEDEDEEMDDYQSPSSGVTTPDAQSEAETRRSKPFGRYSPAKYRRKIVPRPKMKTVATEGGARSRMFTEDIKISRWSKTKAWTENFGSELEDLYPVIQTRDVWHGAARDVVLPSRRSVKVAMDMNARGRYVDGYASTRSEFEATRQNDSTQTPYYQSIRHLSNAEFIDGGYMDLPVHNEIILGPHEKGVKHELRPGIPLNALQSKAEHGIPDDQKVEAALPENTSEPSDGGANVVPAASTSKNQSGKWLINTGASPSSLSWAPAMNGEQYLAISFRCTQAQRDKVSSSTSPHAPAFSPSPSYPSHIQIWRVSGEGREGDPATMQKTSTAQLPLRLATKWGNNLRIEWIPLVVDLESNTRSLAILSSDGSIRMVDIDLSKIGTYAIEQPKFIASPPEHTIFTAFALPSHQDLIAGGADGAIYLYDTRECGSAQPYATIQLHNTYIMALSVASDFPHLLASSSASGDTQLIDLRAPEQDKVRIHRARLPTSSFAYSPLLHTFFTTSDASGNSEPHGTSLSTLIAFNVRHFYKTSTILKLPELQGIATAMCLSTFHPFILTANAAGQIYCTNVLRRLLPTTLKDGEPLGWMVKLFELDWIETKREGLTSNKQNPKETNNDNANGKSSTSLGKSPANRHDGDPKQTAALRDVFHGRDMRSGTTRIYDNFRPNPIELATFGIEGMNPRTAGNNKAARRSTGIASAASHQCIFHDEQSVTTMAWNPNPRFSTWAAIGWASGIICITDLGHGMA